MFIFVSICVYWIPHIYTRTPGSSSVPQGSFLFSFFPHLQLLSLLVRSLDFIIPNVVIHSLCLHVTSVPSLPLPFPLHESSPDLGCDCPLWATPTHGPLCLGQLPTLSHSLYGSFCNVWTLTLHTQLCLCREVLLSVLVLWHLALRLNCLGWGGTRITSTLHLIM